MSPSPYNNVIGGLCRFFLLGASDAKRQRERESNDLVMWQSCGMLDRTLWLLAVEPRV